MGETNLNALNEFFVRSAEEASQHEGFYLSGFF